MNNKPGLFRTADGKNYVVTFLLISTLFLLWGLCNGMIDVLNKHFQNSLDVSKAQSALVQFANYMGYFLMAIPSGLLARRFGYKGGIMIGLVLIALGAFWFIPATRIGTYWAFLTGLFILATGLTCLETIANPYTTVLGPLATGPTRINLAQSCNGIGWMLGPMVGGFFLFSSTGEENRSNAELYKPYLLVAVVVTVLLIIFAFSNVPDLQAEEESKAKSGHGNQGSGKPLFKRWHFVLAIVAQFLYVAAQTGIFSFFVNYVVSDVPNLGLAASTKLPAKMTYSAAMLSVSDFKEPDALTAKLQNDPDAKTRPVSQFLWSQFGTSDLGTNIQKVLTYPTVRQLLGEQENTRDIKDMLVEIDTINAKRKPSALVGRLNRLLQTNTLYEPQRFAGVPLSADTRNLLQQKPQGESLVRLNRRLLEETYPEKLIPRSSYLQNAEFRITERGAAILLSFGGFGLFLLGRFSGSMVLRVFKAHSTLALYCLADALMMLLVMLPLGWVSVGALFMSFFFMSIMFPTIFALGIRGLGEHTKLASSLIVMSIVGGAVMPLLMGWIADIASMRVGFVMPLACFVVMFFYAIFWPKLEAKDTGAAA